MTGGWGTMWKDSCGLCIGALGVPGWKLVQWDQRGQGSIRVIILRLRPGPLSSEVWANIATEPQPPLGWD